MSRHASRLERGQETLLLRFQKDMEVREVVTRTAEFVDVIVTEVTMKAPTC